MPPVSWWIGFNAAVLVLLVVDLGLFHRKDRTVSTKNSLLWTAVWVILALIFNGWLVTSMGGEAGLQFFTCYLIEKSLSVDNLFVFLILFRYFKIPPEFQHKVLFWGVLGALIMRLVMVVAGVSLLDHFHWLTYVFGLILLVGAARMWGDPGKFDPNHGIFAWLSHRIPISQQLHDGKFWFRENGQWIGSRLLLTLIMVELSDVIFALDSVPASLAVTHNAFIVYTSNVLAVLGLRSLYFAVAGSLERLSTLHYGLAVVLAFVGIKMIVTDLVEIPTWVSLAVFLGILSVTLIASRYRHTALAGTTGPQTTPVSPV